ncbi:hypothetical protein N665_0003s0026 [Sinapis alba]|nr:hypothetical protein N665_0003s0026 [Sinapis alba]
MQPLKLHFPSIQHQKFLKLSGKCYIDTALRNIQTILKEKEVEWFIEHPQFQHFFHIKNRKQKRFRLIYGLCCHEYPPNHERLGGKRVTYADLEKQMLAMKLKPHHDRLKMVVLYFLANILVGSRKSGEGASPVDSFFMTVIDDLDGGGYAFEHNLKDVSSFLEKCDGLCRRLLAFEAIPSLRNHFRETVNGARPGCPRMCKMQYKRKGETKSYSLNAMNGKLGETKEKLRYYLAHDIHSVLVATTAEKGILKCIGMGKESCWADDLNDAAIDRWTKIIQKGKKQIFFEEQFFINVTTRTSPVEGPTIAAIKGPSNNAKSGQTHADSVEASGVEALKALEDRLMNAIRDVLKEVNQKFNLLGNQLTPLEKEQNGGDTPSEQDGGDTPLEKVKDGGSKDVSVVDIAKKMQSEHGKGNDDMDETAKRCAATEKLESQMSENDVAKVGETGKEIGDVQTETKKKKRERKGDGKEKKKEESSEKRTKGAKKKSGEKKQKDKAAEKEEPAEKRTACVQKKEGGKKQKKTKKGGHLVRIPHSASAMKPSMSMSLFKAFICMCSSYR